MASIITLVCALRASCADIVPACALAALLVGCGAQTASTNPPDGGGSVPYEFVYVDSGGHTSFATNAEAQERVREFVGSTGAATPGQVSPVSTSYVVDGMNLPVEVLVYVPDGTTGPLDVVVLLHGTIESATVKPQDAAAMFIALMRNNVGVSDRLLVSVAYPQDAIPPANQTAFGDVSNLLFGDNIRYVRAALGWTRDQLPSWLSSNAPATSVGRTYVFGHSQGGFLAHQLNALVATDGVITNAPGPVDLLDRCRRDEEGPNDNITCNKLEMALGPTTMNGAVYTERSLRHFLTGNRARALFLQATNDAPYQVQNMRDFESAFRQANP